MTRLDLRSAYNQVRMMYDDGHQEDSIVATAFQSLTLISVSCLQDILVLIFGFCNALAVYFRLVNHVLKPYISDYVIV